MSKCNTCLNRETFSLGDNYPMGMVATFCTLGYWDSLNGDPNESDPGDDCPDYKEIPTLMEAMRWLTETKDALFHDAGGEEAFQKFKDNLAAGSNVEPENK
jgi:hypothetical protein